MSDRLSGTEKKARSELKELICCFIALKHIHQLIKKEKGEVKKISDKKAKSEIKHILRKLRSGFFGSVERDERKIAHIYQELMGDIKEAETELTSKEVSKIESILGDGGAYNALLEKDASRGGVLEKVLKKAMKESGEKRVRMIEEEDEEIIRDIQTIEGFEIEMKEIIAEIEEIGRTKASIEKSLKSSLKGISSDISEIITAFKPVFSTTNVADRKRLIFDIKKKINLEGIKILGVGGNALVLKVNLHGKDYALKLSVENLSNELVCMSKARGIGGIPKFYFETTINGLHSILMELVDGQTMEEYILSHPLPEDFFEKLDLTIMQLHQKGVAHKDLQGANIMVVRGQPYLLDFSLSSPKAKACEKRFDEIFIEGLKAYYLRYVPSYHNQKKYLAAATNILLKMKERLKTETVRENIETINIYLGQARKLGLPV